MMRRKRKIKITREILGTGYEARKRKTE